jgi:hypothetical protein
VPRALVDGIDERYTGSFPEFLAKLSSSSVDDSLRSVYGKNLDQLTADVRDFIIWNGTTHPLAERQNFWPANIEYDGPVADPELLPVLAYVAKPGSPAENDIKEEVQDLAALNPNDARPEEALAFRAIEDGDEAEARIHLRLPSRKALRALG